MSSIAEFYSRNLAAEVTKGLSTKAQRGGTVSKAPIGYRNHRTIDEQGREMRTVIVDEERAQHVKSAFGLYATGAWTVAALAEFLADRGFTTLPTPKIASKPVGEKYLHRVLTNPYYRGVVTYKGVQYPGRHDRLVDDETWFTVQGILESHYNGDRVRKHNHYLKNSMWCGQCGERMLVTSSRSASGDIYPYLFCAGRHSKRTTCTQRSVLIYEIERKVEDLYLRIQIDATFRAHVEAQMRAELGDARSEVERLRVSLKKKQEQLTRERGKLMEAHYAGAIPVDLLGQEQNRISKGLASIQTELDATNEKWEVIERNLGRALDLATDCHNAYTSAPEHIRRLFNQAFFEKILILPDDNDRVGVRLEAELAEPFDALLTKAKRSAGDASGPLRQSSNHSSALTQSICLSKDTVVELARQCSNLAPALLHASSIHKSIRRRLLPTSGGMAGQRKRLPRPVPRLTELMLGEAQRRYEDGEVLRVIASDLGVSRTRLSARLRERGVLLRRVSPTDEQVLEMCHRYEQGQSLARVGASLGLNASTVRITLLRAGVTLRDAHGRER